QSGPAAGRTETADRPPLEDSPPHAEKHRTDIRIALTNPPHILLHPTRAPEGPHRIAAEQNASLVGTKPEVIRRIERCSDGAATNPCAEWSSDIKSTKYELSRGPITSLIASF